MTAPSPDQLRASRAFLGWSKIELARIAGVSVSSVLNAEGRRPESVTAGAVGAIRVALESAGISFSDDERGTGVRLARPVGRVIRPG